PAHARRRTERLCDRALPHERSAQRAAARVHRGDARERGHPGVTPLPPARLPVQAVGRFPEVPLAPPAPAREPRTPPRPRPPLPPKLDALPDRARAAGIHAETFTVMSGYRTPAYNRAIGNATSLSRHLFGAGADVFVDANHDGRMDDLNGDGVVDQRDAAVL